MPSIPPVANDEANLARIVSMIMQIVGVEEVCITLRMQLQEPIPLMVYVEEGTQATIIKLDRGEQSS